MQGIGEIARNLLNLEVNTIISNGISAEKMPGAVDALVDVAQEFHRFLCMRVADLRNAGAPIDNRLPQIGTAAGVDTFEVWHVDTGGLTTFEALRRAATCCLASAHEIGLDWRQYEVILDRIRRNSDQIKAIYQAIGEPDVPSDLNTIELSPGTSRADAAQARHTATGPILQLDGGDLVKIRKIWEVSTQVVAMQTVIQIDGDVFSRIQSGWERPGYEVLHDLHRQAVEISFEHWSYLFKAVTDITSAVFQDFFRRKA